MRIARSFMLAQLTICSGLLGQAPSQLGVQNETLSSRPESFLTRTIHVDGLALTYAATDEYLRAGDMPTVLKRRDDEGRNTTLTTDGGSKIVEIKIKANGLAEEVSLGTALRLAVTRLGPHSYQQTLVGAKGRSLFDRQVDTTTRRPPDEVVLDPVAAQLGLTADWRNEIVVTRSEGLVTVASKTGRVLVYVVRNGGDKVGFTPDGKPLYYEVMADLYAGKTSEASEYPNLQTLIPDRFIYTRDGRVGAYVWTPARNGISAVWTDRDASGVAVVRFRSGSAGEAPTHANGVSIDGVKSDAQNPSASPMIFARIRQPVRQDFCIVDYTTTDWGDGTSTTVITDVQCFYFGGGGGGGGGGASGGGGGSTYSSNGATGPLNGKVNAALQNATTKLPKPACTALLSNLTDASGQALLSIMNQRGFADPVAYITSGVGFYSGQGHRDAQGTVPCDYGPYAWTTPGSTQIWVCDLFGTIGPGMAGVIAIHEMLHTLGLPEDGPGLTSQQITQMVSDACGAN